MIELSREEKKNAEDVKYSCCFIIDVMWEYLLVEVSQGESQRGIVSESSVLVYEDARGDERCSRKPVPEYAT